MEDLSEFYRVYAEELKLAERERLENDREAFMAAQDVRRLMTYGPKRNKDDYSPCLN